MGSRSKLEGSLTDYQLKSPDSPKTVPESGLEPSASGHSCRRVRGQSQTCRGTGRTDQERIKLLLEWESGGWPRPNEQYAIGTAFAEICILGGLQPYQDRFSDDSRLSRQTSALSRSHLGRLAEAS